MDNLVHGDVFHVSLSTIYTGFRCVLLTMTFFLAEHRLRQSFPSCMKIFFEEPGASGQQKRSGAGLWLRPPEL